MSWWQACTLRRNSEDLNVEHGKLLLPLPSAGSQASPSMSSLMQRRSQTHVEAQQSTQCLHGTTRCSLVFLQPQPCCHLSPERDDKSISTAPHPALTLHVRCTMASACSARPMFFLRSKRLIDTKGPSAANGRRCCAVEASPSVPLVIAVDAAAAWSGCCRAFNACASIGGYSTVSCRRRRPRKDCISRSATRMEAAATSRNMLKRITASQ